MNLSEHVTKAEFEGSNTAKARNLNNVMNEAQTAKAIDLCVNVFEPIRAYLGKPIRINCGYRSPEVNKAVGGATTSQHMKGEAMDLDLHDRELFDWILENVEIDQAIFEFGTEDHAGWFHLSYNKGKNRKQALRAMKKNGKTVYVPYIKKQS